MHEWLQGKLDRITEEFLEGHGQPVIYEAAFLGYLECLVAHVNGVRSVTHFWDHWGNVCAKATPEGQKVRCLSSTTSDREELVQALRRFQQRFCTRPPLGKKARPDPAPAPEPPRASEDGKVPDIFEFLS